MDFGPLVQASNPGVREIQPTQGLDLGNAGGPRLYPQLPSQESASGISIRVLLKRKWIVLACLITIFSVVAIASLKMTPIYEASGTIEINKPDTSLNFQNSATFSLDYYDPTELETELKILQSDLLAMQVIRELNLDRRPEFAGQAPPPPQSSLDLAPDPLQSDPTRALGHGRRLQAASEGGPQPEHAHHRGALSQPRSADGRQRRQHADADLR